MSTTLGMDIPGIPGITVNTPINTLATRTTTHTRTRTQQYIRQSTPQPRHQQWLYTLQWLYNIPPHTPTLTVTRIRTTTPMDTTTRMGTTAVTQAVRIMPQRRRQKTTLKRKLRMKAAIKRQKEHNNPLKKSSLFMKVDLNMLGFCFWIKSFLKRILNC